MQTLVERRYIFKRRPMKGRIILAAIASALSLGALTLKTADARPGGYQRAISMEDPAK